MNATNYRITPEFEEFFGEARLNSLNRHAGTVYSLDSDFIITYLNPAWYAFAKENGGDHFVVDAWSLGRNIFDAIPCALKPFYRDVFETTLHLEKPSVMAHQLEYECSSANQYRRFSMHLYSLGPDGLLAVHSLLVEEPHQSSQAQGVILFNEDNYLDTDGIVCQCANCRRVKHRHVEQRWDWIPKWVNEPTEFISHGVCPPCMQHYYLSALRKAQLTRHATKHKQQSRK